MRKKILFYATHPNQNNGYARIGHRLTNFLADYFDIYYFAFSNFNDILVPREIHPNIKIIDCVAEEAKFHNETDVNKLDPFGCSIVKQVIKQIEPDILLIYNDVIVISRHLNVINQIKTEPHHPFKVVTYLDLVYDYEKPLFLDFIMKFCDQVITFSEHWKQNLLNMGYSDEKIRILYHGFDTEMFFKTDKKLSRTKVSVEENDFVILNTNRNSYRKAQDITIAAFLKFLKMNNFKENIKLMFHCNLNVDSGYDLLSVIRTECMKLKIEPDRILNHHILRLPQFKISDEDINHLYNACDIGINTCVGEGFGLCNLEHAGLEKPQVVSKVGGLKDIFMDYPQFTVEPVAEINIPAHTDAHNGTIYICRSEDFAYKLNEIYHNYDKYENDAKSCSEYIKDKFDWNKILLHLKDLMDENI